MDERLQSISCNSILQNTRIGWVLTGPIHPAAQQNEISNALLFASVSSNNQVAEFLFLGEIKNYEVYIDEEK